MWEDQAAWHCSKAPRALSWPGHNQHALYQAGAETDSSPYNLRHVCLATQRASPKALLLPQMAFVAQGVTEHHAFGAAAQAKMSEAGCSCHPRLSRVFKNKSYLPCNVIWNATRRGPQKSFYQPRSREEGRVGLTNDGYRCKTRPMASLTLQSSAFHHRGRQTRVSPELYQHRNLGGRLH